MDYKHIFIERLKTALAQHSMSDIARKMGVAPSSISRYLHGKTSISLDRLDVLEQSLGLPHGWFLSQDDAGGMGLPFYERIEDAIDKAEPKSRIMIDHKLFSEYPAFICLVGSDTMSPTLNIGDMAVFSNTKESDKPLIQGVFCMAIGKGVVIGRPLVSGDQVTIVFENKDYPNLDVSIDNVSFLYRVTGSIKKL